MTQEQMFKEFSKFIKKYDVKCVVATQPKRLDNILFLPLVKKTNPLHVVIIDHLRIC